MGQGRHPVVMVLVVDAESVAQHFSICLSRPIGVELHVLIPLIVLSGQGLLVGLLPFILQLLLLVFSVALPTLLLGCQSFC